MATTPDYYIVTIDTSSRPHPGAGNCADEANRWAFGLAQAATGEDGESHLGGYFWKRFGEEVCRPHAGLHRAERMLPTEAKLITNACVLRRVVAAGDKRGTGLMRMSFSRRVPVAELLGHPVYEHSQGPSRSTPSCLPISLARAGRRRPLPASRWAASRRSIRSRPLGDDYPRRQ